MVTLYGKPGCHLCDDAREVVERVRAGHPFELRRSTSRSIPGSTASTASASRYWNWTARSYSSSTSMRPNWCGG